MHDGQNFTLLTQRGSRIGEFPMRCVLPSPANTPYSQAKGRRLKRHLRVPCAVSAVGFNDELGFDFIQEVDFKQVYRDCSKGNIYPRPSSS
jgi:hypothetical protein